LHVLLEPAGGLAADAAAGDLVGFLALQIKQTPCSV